MREIKFRAFIIGLNIVRDVRAIHFECGRPFLVTVELLPEDTFDADWRGEMVVLMQFTGLHDYKNGKEIYGGDVLADKYGNRMEVIYDDGTWWAQNESEHLKRALVTVTIAGNEYEVIANDLLKGPTKTKKEQ